MKSKFGLFIVGAAVLIICIAVFILSNRFQITRMDGNVAYKIDKLTGATWLIYGTKLMPINEEAAINGEDFALSLAKDSRLLHSSLSNEEYIRQRLNSLIYSYESEGWVAKSVADNLYLVSFLIKKTDSSFDRPWLTDPNNTKSGGLSPSEQQELDSLETWERQTQGSVGSRERPTGRFSQFINREKPSSLSSEGWVFEVNAKDRTVRRVNPLSALSEHYNISVYEPSNFDPDEYLKYKKK